MRPYARFLLILVAAFPALGQDAPAPPPTPPQIPWPESQQFSLFRPGETQFRVDFGVQPITLDTESSKFEEYRDVPDRIALPFFGLSSFTDDVRYVITGEDVGQNDVRFTVKAERGNFGLNLIYDQIPHQFGNDARTLLEQTTRERFEVSDTLQRTFQTAIEQRRAASPASVNLAFLSDLVAPSFAAANAIDIGLERRRGLIEVSYSPGELWEWGGSQAAGADPTTGGPTYGLKLSYFQENRVGDRQAGTSFGFGNVVETPESVDYKTRDIGITGELPLGQAIVRGSLFYNDFTNNITAQIFDNPFRAVDSTDPNAYQSPSSSSINGPTRGLVALPPNNKALTGTVGFLMKLPATSRLNADIAVSRWSQDDLLFAYTTNTAITTPVNASDPGSLPVRRFDGQINTISGGLSFNSRPLPRLGISARYRIYDMNNESERVEFPGYVRFDSVWEEIPRITVPYEWGTNRGDLAVTYDLGPVTLEGGYRHDRMDRTFRETEQTTENTLRLAADFRPWQWVSARASYEFGKRDFDHYDLEHSEHASYLEPGPTVNLSELRRFDQAKRDTNRLSALVQLTPFQGNMGVTLQYLGNRDDYDEDSDIGLLKVDNDAWTVEVDYAPAERWSVYGFYTKESYDMFQRGRQSGATPSTDPRNDWTADVADRVDSFGVGGTYAISPKVDFKLFSRYQRVNGFNDLESPPGGTPDIAVDIPQFDDTRLWTTSAEFEYRLAEASRIALGGWFEDYEIRDAFTTGIGNYMPGGFFLAPNDADYRGNVIYLRASFRR